eukprot:702426-Amorphochlora_amoeboformis.AAC.1
MTLASMTQYVTLEYIGYHLDHEVGTYVLTVRKAENRSQERKTNNPEGPGGPGGYHRDSFSYKSYGCSTSMYTPLLHSAFFSTERSLPPNLVA